MVMVMVMVRPNREMVRVRYRFTSWVRYWNLEEIAFNLSDSIVVQIPAENERNHSLLRMRTFHAIFMYHSSLTDVQVERDFGKNSIQWRKSRSRTEIYNMMRGWRWR